MPNDWTPSPTNTAPELVAELVRQFRGLAGNVRDELERMEAIVAQLVEPSHVKAEAPIASAATPNEDIGLAEPVASSVPETDLAFPTGADEDIGLAEELAVAGSATDLAPHMCSDAREGVTEDCASASTPEEIPCPEPLPPAGGAGDLLLRKGVQLLRSGDTAQAIAFFSEALSREADLVEAYLERGQAHHQRGEFRRAVADFTTAIALVPDKFEGYLRRGNSLSAQNKLEEAIADYNAALALAPEQPILHLNRALARARQGRYGHVIEDAGTALRLNARLSAARFVRGVAHANLGRAADALADFDQLIREEPNNALAHNERGLFHARAGSYEIAIADYTRAVQIDPNLLLPRYNRALAYRLKGEQEQAVVEFTEVLRRRPQNEAAHYQRGLAQLALGRLDAALTDFDAALERNPQWEEPRIGRRRVLKAKARHTHRPARVPMESGMGPARKANADTSQALTVICPGCKATGQIRWDRIGGLVQCAGCKSHYRMGTDGSMEPVDVPHGIWVSVRSFLPGATRHWVPLPNDEQAQQRRRRQRRNWITAAAVLLLAVAGTSGFFLLRTAEAAEEPLPEELAARAERFAQAWVGKEPSILRRLTSSAHDRVLRRWQASNPAPTLPEDPHALRISALVLKERGASAEVMVRVAGLGGEKPSAELRQRWERRAGLWFFVPPRDYAPMPRAVKPPVKPADTGSDPAKTPPVKPAHGETPTAAR